MSNPQLNLIIDMPIRRLSARLTQARQQVSNATGAMRRRLNEIRLPRLDTTTLRQNLRNSQQAITGWVNNVRTRISGMAERHREAIGGMMDQIPGLSGGLSKLANPYTLIAAAIGAVIFAGVKLVKHLFETSAAIGKHQAILRATFAVTGNELDRLTAKTMATANVFERDFGELASSANNLFQEFKDGGLTANGAMKLIQRGLIATNNMMDIDNVREYTAQLKQAGLTAEQSISIIAGQVSAGIFSDKGVDTIKEAGLRLREMTKGTQDALKGIGLSPKKIMDDLNSGAKTTWDVIKDVTAAMSKAGTMQRQTAIADVFGGPGEDLGERALLNMGKMNASLDDLIAKQGPYAQSLQQRLALEESIAQKQVAIAPAFNAIQGKIDVLILKGKEWFYDVISQAVNYLMQYKDQFAAVFDFIVSVLKFVANTAVFAWKVIFGLLVALVKTEIIGFKDMSNEFGYFVDSIAYGLQMAKLRFMQFGQFALGIISNISKAWDLAMSGDFSAAKDALTAKITTDAGAKIDALQAKRKTDRSAYEQTRENNFKDFADVWKQFGARVSSKKTAAKAEEEKDSELMPGSVGKGGGMPGGGGGKSAGLGSDVSKVAGESQSVRNISIKFDSYIKGDVLTQNTMIKNMSSQELLRWLDENFQRLVYSAEKMGG